MFLPAFVLQPLVSVFHSDLCDFFSLQVPEHFFGVFKVARACMGSAVLFVHYFLNISGKLERILITFVLTFTS